MSSSLALALALGPGLLGTRVLDAQAQVDGKRFGAGKAELLLCWCWSCIAEEAEYMLVSHNFAPEPEPESEIDCSLSSWYQDRKVYTHEQLGDIFTKDFSKVVFEYGIFG